jgi:hypothetical protein
VAEGVKQLGSVDVSALSAGVINIQHIRKNLAPDFVPTFKSLYNITCVQETALQRKEAKRAAHFAHQSISSSSVQPTTPVSKHDILTPLTEPTTPDQPTHPEDPKWSGSSTASQDEEATKKLISDFLSDTMTILESEFQTIYWQRSGRQVELLQTFFPLTTLP